MPCLDLLVLGKAKSPTIPFLPLLSTSDDQPKPQKLRDKTRLHAELIERLLLPFLCYPKLHIYTPSEDKQS